MGSALNYAIFVIALTGLSSTIKVFIGQDDEISMIEIPTRKKIYVDYETGNDLFKFGSIDYIYNDSLVFYTVNDSIVRATIKYDDVSRTFNLTNGEVIWLQEEGDGPLRLAVDWVHRQLYWMSDMYQTILTSDLEGNNVRDLVENIEPNFSFPNNIVVDPYKGVVFFVSNHAVYWSNITGSRAEIFYIDGNELGREGRGVRTIALDRVNKKLYYSGKEHPGSANKYYFARVGYGYLNDNSFGEGDEEEFNMDGLNDIYSMDVFGDTLFLAHYINKGYKGISHCSDVLKTVSTNFSGDPNPDVKFIPNPCKNGIWSVKVYHPCAQTLVCDHEDLTFR